MLVSLKDFDPIIFLHINSSSLLSEEIDKMRQHLNGKIGEYILLRLSTHLTTEQLEKVTLQKDGKAIINMLGSLIPSLQTKILHEMENFKKDYLETLKGSMNG